MVSTVEQEVLSIVDRAEDLRQKEIEQAVMFEKVKDCSKQFCKEFVDKAKKVFVMSFEIAQMNLELFETMSSELSALIATGQWEEARELVTALYEQ